jgi:hypothetical protein
MRFNWYFYLACSFVVFLFSNCKSANQKLVGTWEYESYEIAPNGIGKLAEFIPEKWKNEIDSWIEKTKGLTNSQMAFYPDGTYKESFSGWIEDFTSVMGHFELSKNLSQLKLIADDKEQVLPILSISDDCFTYAKELNSYNIPLTIFITYKKVPAIPLAP